MESISQAIGIPADALGDRLGQMARRGLIVDLDRADLLICDELGYLSFSRTGAELLFQVFAERLHADLHPRDSSLHNRCTCRSVTIAIILPERTCDSLPIVANRKI